MKNLWWVAFIGLLLSFFLLSFVPQGKGEEQSESKTTSGSLVETIIALKEQVPVLKTVYLSPLTIRKIFGHFLYCFLIAFCGFYCLATFLHRRIIVLRCMLVICLMVSAAGEILQVFAFGRYPSVIDVSINLSGALLGLFLAYFLKQNILTKYLGE
ncbi:MAG: VanZ family protein [Bacilli bacterium]|nr:VanZ family protein [Bacilli bacterium]HHU23599.1 VanZ family protein [Acholeplasmataceae bacterium]